MLMKIQWRLLSNVILSAFSWVYKLLTSSRSNTDFKNDQDNPSSSSSFLSEWNGDTHSVGDAPRYGRPKYDVFLNYSYEDIGKGFVSHLKGALSREGFSISDHTMLPVCEDQNSRLLKAIEESGIYLVIYSKSYAASKQCLDELVSIMDCLTIFQKRRVFPIFYNVEPTDVKSQKGSGFMEAFRAHQAAEVDPHTLHKWKRALDGAAQKSGLALLNGDEEKFIREIVKELRTMQIPVELFHAKCPVGVESRAGDLISALKLNSHEFRIVAVFGISGSGKTTIVKAVYDKIAADFEYRCFIEDVYSYEDRWGRRWKFELQKDVISCLTRNAKSAIIDTHTNGAAKIMKLIRGRKALLVLDGANTFQHLEALGIHHASFSCLSRIIVTTTNKQSLVNLPCTSYDMRLLDTIESFDLFSGLTFGKDDPVDKNFVEEVVWCAGGLPLVLDIWSCHFKCYERKYWPSILETLKRIPHGDIQKKLQMSYDSLNNRAKKLFLDIACFFDGMGKELVVKVLQDEDSGFFPEFEIQHLVDKGLVKLKARDIIGLHEVIKEMGREVVRQENEDEPGQRTRLMERDVVRVLRDCSGTESVESIRWIEYSEEGLELTYEALRKMMNLRLIKLSTEDPLEDAPAVTWSDSFHDTMAPLCFKKLRYMEWEFFPFKSLDVIDMTSVVVLRLSASKLEILWKGLKSLKKLRILNVTFSESLTKTGSFSGLENLEDLSFEFCNQLEELHGSISQLHKLRKIMLDGCAKLKSIPDLPASIEEIEAGDCTSLVKLPDSIGQLHKLRKIRLDGCAKLESIPNLPSTIEKIEARDCTSLVNLPDNMGQLHKLRDIMLNACAKLESIPDFPPSIETIYAVDCTSLVNIPDSVGQLHKLRELYLSGCAKLESVPNLPPSIEVIKASECGSLVNLPSSIGQLHKLREICLFGCAKLESLPNLPPSIEVIRASECRSLVNLPNSIGQLHQLREICLFGCAKLESIPDLQPSIEVIRASECRNLVNLPDSIVHLHRLREIWLSGCGKLESIPNLPPSIEAIYARDCTSLVTLPDNIGQLHKLREIALDKCVKLESIPDLPPSIEVIEASHCSSLVNLPSNMSELQLLRHLYLDGCFKLEPGSLKKVSILFKESLFTRGSIISLSGPGWGAKLPDWCGFQNRGGVLSIVAPMNLDKKICGVIICSTVEKYSLTTPRDLKMLNKTKNTSLDNIPRYCGGSMLVLPLDNTKLVVEAGDLVELQFNDVDVLSCGLRLIYEGDFLDHALLIPTTKS